MKVGIVGGTGSFGLALAERLVAAGDEVTIGSRDAGRAAEAAQKVGAAGATNMDAATGADIVVLSVKAEAALDTARDLADAIGGRPVLCVASELSFTKAGVFPTDEPTSVAERVQELVRGPVLAGLHSLAASELAGDDAPEQDALVCGDDADGKALALELAAKVVSGKALDAGPLASARALEGMTAVIVNLNKRYKAHAGLRVTGV